MQLKERQQTLAHFASSPNVFLHFPCIVSSSSLPFLSQYLAHTCMHRHSFLVTVTHLLFFAIYLFLCVSDLYSCEPCNTPLFYSSLPQCHSYLGQHHKEQTLQIYSGIDTNRLTKERQEKKCIKRDDSLRIF